MSEITVTAKVMGQSAQVHEDLETPVTVGDIQELMDLEGNYTYNVGGKPATKDTELSDGAYVVFAPSVKGAAKTASKPAKTTKKATTKKK